MELYADGNRGIFIPQHFARSIKREFVTGVSDEDWAILDAGPDHDLYWSTWDDVLSDAVITDPAGVKWTLWQDGDLWLVKEGEEIPEG
jgi:hypothetical protein